MTDTKGRVVAVNGNLISVAFDGTVSLNEVGYVSVGDKKLKSEVIRIQNGEAQLQVFEMTKGIQTGDEVFLRMNFYPLSLVQAYLDKFLTGFKIRFLNLQNKLDISSNEASILTRFPMQALGLLPPSQKWAIR